MTWRLEPSTRSSSIEEGLAARVHDPLWLLARQWQLGEFSAKDAGTPAVVRALGSSTPVNAWRGTGLPAWTNFDPATTPLDALVEPEDEPAPDLRERIEAGAHFLRLLGAAGLQRYAQAVVQAHAFTPAELGAPALAADALWAAIARHQPDGAALFATAQALATGGPAAVAIDPADQAAVAALAGQWLAWWADEIAAAPGAGTAASWQENRLEYGFDVSCGAAGGTVLRATAYAGDGLDWFDFDIDPTATASPGAAPIPIDRSAVPMPVRYGGMPLPRFWAMEDARYDFGATDASASDIGRLLLVEFATVYGNDWFVLPLKLPVGSLTVLDSLVATDVFGRHLLMERAGAADPQWNLFSLASTGAAHGAQQALFLPPTSGSVIEGAPVESVQFLRDEMADLAWGVEGVVQDALGQRIDRRAHWAGHVAPPPGDPALPTYRVETVVPDYWVPLAPEQAAPGQAVRLRLVPLEIDDGGTPRALEPQGRLLQAKDPSQRLWLHEEEVPREGTRLDRVPRYARWQFGRYSVWTARRRGTGRGEGSSGLKYDVLDPG